MVTLVQDPRGPCLPEIKRNLFAQPLNHLINFMTTVPLEGWSFFFFLNLICLFGHTAQLAVSYFPDQGSNLCPLQWKLDHQGSSSPFLLREAYGLGDISDVLEIRESIPDFRRVGNTQQFLS